MIIENYFNEFLFFSNLMNKRLVLIIVTVLILLAVFGYFYFRSGQEREIKQEEGMVSFDSTREREFLKSLTPREASPFNREKELELLRNLAPR